MKHARRSIRLKGYEYARAGAYFVTLCARGRECVFGEVVNGAMRLTDGGRIVEQCWQAIPQHFAHVELDAFVVMPDHVHGILVFHRRGTACRAPTCRAPATMAEQFGKPVAGSLPTIIRSFKSAVTRHINALPGTCFAWQRNYYEHVIRDDADLRRIRDYIFRNPSRWTLTQE